MTCNGCKNKINGGTIIHTEKLPTRLMMQISGHDTIEDSADKLKSRVNKGKFSVQIYLFLNLMCQVVHRK